MNVLGIFVKHPVPGHVKTRLAKDIGDERAAQLYEAFTGDIIDRFRQAAERRVLCYSPNTSQSYDYFSAIIEDPLPPRGGWLGWGGEQSSRINSALRAPAERDRRNPRPPDYALWPQPGGSLGERLEQFFAHAFANCGTRVVVIGSDSPTLPLEYVEQAFALLQCHDCVLGPATDGGYYLIGQSGRPWPIFANIDWGSPRVCAQTITRVKRCGARLAQLPQWYDIDTIADLELLRTGVTEERNNGKATSIPRTNRVLEDIRNS